MSALIEYLLCDVPDFPFLFEVPLTFLHVFLEYILVLFCLPVVAASFVEWKLKKAGCTDIILRDAVTEAILNAPDGTARVINKLCNASFVIDHST